MTAAFLKTGSEHSYYSNLKRSWSLARYFVGSRSWSCSKSYYKWTGIHSYCRANKWSSLSSSLIHSKFGPISKSQSLTKVKEK